MKYRTTIQITTEAADKNEAIEIVGEYLSGNIVSGIKMNCSTNPAVSYKISVVAATAIFFIIMSTVLMTDIKSPLNSVQGSSGISAIQPPLKTSCMDNRNADFKKDWQNNQTKRALEYIKR